MEERTRFVIRLTDGETMAALCREFGISRKTSHAVGVKEVDDGTWLVSFINYDRGYIDLEERTLQPRENPFGPKV